ncbi:MAG: cytochrome d ubiquinol oxidase subunit II [Betaproteobacteria bacterium]
MNTAWFVVLVVMLGGYAVLDGFDLGVGALHLVLPRDEDERALAIDAIGPVWNGNEVWLLAAGGAMVVAFPLLYAASFSGFYLALMLVLWLLVFRGLGIEFRHQVDHPIWRDFWDAAFSVASILLAVLFGVALGNVLRGVPMDGAGNFQGTFTLMLNPFAVLGGVLSLSVLCLHGASYLAMKTAGPLGSRASAFVGPLWGSSVALAAAMVVASFVVRPDFTRNFVRWPWLGVAPAFAVAAIVALRVFWSRGKTAKVFFASAAIVVGLLGSAAAGLYPRLLPTPYGSAFGGLDIYNTASAPGSLRTAMVIYLIGMAIVIAYLVNAFRVWGGKVTGEHEYKI